MSSAALRGQDLLVGEARIVGRVALIVPLGVVALFGALGLVTVLTGGGTDALSHWVLAAVEGGLPLVATLVAVQAVGNDPMLERHLSLPARYAATVLRRVAAAVGPSAAVALLAGLVVAVSGAAGGVGWMASPLIWAAPMLSMVALGLALTALTRSPTTASTVVALLWLLQWLLGPMWFDGRAMWFRTTLTLSTDGWLLDRGLLLAAAILLLVPAMAAATRADYQMRGADQ